MLQQRIVARSSSPLKTTIWGNILMFFSEHQTSKIQVIQVEEFVVRILPKIFWVKADTPLRTNMTRWKIPILSIGNIHLHLLHSWWEFPPCHCVGWLRGVQKAEFPGPFPPRTSSTCSLLQMSRNIQRYVP